MPTPSPRRRALLSFWLPSLLLAFTLVVPAGCCATPPLSAAAAPAGLPEVGEAWPRRTH